MMRKKASFSVRNMSLCKQQMLGWINRFSICCFMDSCGYYNKYSAYDCLAAAGAETVCFPPEKKLADLRAFSKRQKDWLFGHVGYDLKNEIENLSSSHTDLLQFPDLFFFQPKVVFVLQNHVLSIESLHEEPALIYEEMINQTIEKTDVSFSKISIQNRIKKEEYIETIQKVKEHILRGDCYEMNYCQEFFSEDAVINPVQLYQRLTELSPSPFSAYYKLEDKYAVCASPERYLCKKQSRLISQPIKGTAARNIDDTEADEMLKKELRNSEKNKIENVMITDLVRNDLSKICKAGTVTVTELFGIYSYPQVHQMITTIEGEVDVDIGIADMLEATFPMGSMTGAPKRKVMQLIELFEKEKRGLYSGSIGYITPNNDWDFNVVIRSLLYNESNQYLSFQTGGAITFGSDAEEEYEECLLKAKAMRKALGVDES